MKRIKTLVIILGIFSSLKAQKPSLTDTSYKSWTKVWMSVLSPNGKYASYVKSTLSGSDREVIITATDKSWEKRFSGRQIPVFSKGGKDAYTLLKDKLLRIQLSSDRVDTLASCNSFELFTVDRKEYLVYITQSDSLLIASTNGKTKYGFSSAKTYWKPTASDQLVFAQKSKDDHIECLMSLDLKDGKQKRVYCGDPATDVIFDDLGKAIVFVTEAKGQKTLWNLSGAMDTARPIIRDAALENGFKVSLRDVYQFSSDSKRLIVSLEAPKPSYKSSEDPDVWSYEDEILYARFKINNYQTPMIEHFAANLCSVDLATGKLTMLAKPGENVVRTGQRMKDLVVFESVKQSTPNEISKSYAVLDLASNTRTGLQGHFVEGIRSVNYSPDQKWMVYYDADGKQWRCFDRSTKKDEPFAIEIMQELYPYNISRRGLLPGNLEIFGWITGTDRVIMQGTYDLWEVSVTSQIQPINLTRNGQRERKIYSLLQKPADNLFKTTDVIYIFSQNLGNKANSIYKLSLKDQQLEHLLTGNFYWSHLYLGVPSTYFQKAEHQEAFLFTDPNVAQTPNFKFTRDFKNIIELSDCHPENEVNWLTSELLNYKDAEGNLCQAVLYKPENFDSNKKYPIIFNIYADQSQSLNEHLTPELASSGLNIPYMVSNGYLICKPDMYLAKGKISKYLTLSINAVVDYLANKNWVDSTKMGLVGHSFGGWEVNQTITRIHRFAAAITSAGPSSLINTYNDLWDDSGYDKHGIVQDGSFWMGAPLDEATNAYIENTPILYAKSISTPLLILHNEKDAYSQFYHSVHLFTFLKSMGKPAWLLSYPEEGHLIGEEANQFDFLHKATSFFDYYLKGKPKPYWMTRYIKR